MELKGIKMACLGDSITEGVGVTDLSNMYYNRIQGECGIRELYIDGIGGTRIARQQTPSEDPRQDLYFIPRVDDIDEDCDLIVVFGGTNDLVTEMLRLGLRKTAQKIHSGEHVM